MPKKKKQAKNAPLEFIKRHKWVSMVVLGVTAVMLLIGILNAFVFRPVRNPNLGVSFSKERSEELGLDWKANYTALLDDMQLKHFRLMSYWSAHEKTRGQFDFADLDWQVSEAAKRGAGVDIVLGLRQPRWPECWQPDWAYNLKGNDWKQALYSYIKIVVNRYKNNPVVQHWQLENEAVNNWFGACSAPDRQRIDEEFALVKKLDPDRKIRMSLSDQHGLPLGTPVPDEYGFSVYRTVWNTFSPWHFYIIYPTPIWYHRLRATVIDLIQHKPIFIHELQMEPWGPKDTRELSVSEQNKSMSPEQIRRSMTFARQIGTKDIDMWGGEWWYWRKVQFNDDSIWNAVKQEVQDAARD
jgi:hypothetical protein